MRTTRVLVGKDGKVVIEGINYSGNQCLMDLKKLIDALSKVGIKVHIEVQHRKPEANIVLEGSEHGVQF
ncbi:MAG: hypothetical protein DRN90_00290 [Thermoproteota archaeon]|nr:MAG: hypothetical protein DRN90_00290 [Candidatus Korarchaeota archaeon]